MPDRVQYSSTANYQLGWDWFRSGTSQYFHPCFLTGLVLVKAGSFLARPIKLNLLTSDDFKIVIFIGIIPKHIVQNTLILKKWLLKNKNKKLERHALRPFWSSTDWIYWDKIIWKHSSCSKFKIGGDLNISIPAPLAPKATINSFLVTLNLLR